MHARRVTSPTSVAVTVDEACQMLGLSRSSFYRSVKIGELSVKKYGRRTLVPTSEIDRFLESLKGPKKEEANGSTAEK